MITRDEELGFNVTYAMFLSLFSARFYAKLDKLASFFILLCSMAVATEVFNQIVLAFAIAIVSCWQIVFQPSSKSLCMKEQYLNYAALFDQFPTLHADNISDRLIDIRKDDPTFPEILNNIAFNTTITKLNGSERDFKKLNWLEKLVEKFFK